jgi:hypothetical protein
MDGSSLCPRMTAVRGLLLFMRMHGHLLVLCLLRLADP